MSWIDAHKRADVRATAVALGYELSKGRRAFRPCPACGMRGRSPSEKRHAVAVTGRGNWRHYYDQCGGNGDALDLVAYHLHGVPLPQCTPEQRATVRAWFEGGAPTTRPARAVERPRYPSAVELSLMWRLCTPVSCSPDVASYLLSRHLHPVTLDRLEVCRAVRTTRSQAWWPEWWPYEQRRSTAGTFRLAVVGFDGEGNARSMHARSIRSTQQGGKVRWAADRAAHGLLFPNPRGLALMKGHDRAAEGVWVVEGLIDYLTMSQRVAVEGHAHAVFGGTSGSWSALKRIRIPARVPIWVAMDPGETGRRYTREISSALARPVSVVDMGQVRPKQRG